MNENKVIYLPDGSSYRVGSVNQKVLRKEIAAPSISGVRNIWQGTQASGLTPSRLGRILRSAAEGDHHAQLTLAEEMEERELHYISVLGTRKRAISGIDPVVVAASDDAKDQKIADEVRARIVEDPCFVDMVDDLIDGIAKGYSVVELIWNRGAVWTPRYEHRDPRFFRFDRVSGKQIRLIDQTDPEGLPLPVFKFITHIPKLKTGIPARGGLARMVAWAFMFKSYSMKDWMAFLEVFGIPIRIGRYGPQATPEDIDVLETAVANIASDYGAILPEGMTIDFEQVGNLTGGPEIFKGYADFLNREMSKAVLGQVSSTEGEAGRLGNNEGQEDVRQDILKSDARQLGATINRDLVRAFVDLNFGVQDRYPAIKFPVNDPEDIAALTDAVTKLVPLGLRVSGGEMRGKLGLGDPEDDDELLTAPQQVPSTETGLNAHRGCPACDAVALNRSGDIGDVDDIEAEALSEWQEVLAPVVDPIRLQVETAEDLPKLKAALENLGLGLDVDALINAVAAAMAKARGVGDVQD